MLLWTGESAMLCRFWFYSLGRQDARSLSRAEWVLSFSLSLFTNPLNSSILTAVCPRDVFEASKTEQALGF